MALVKKLNVVLTIADDLVDTYLAKGYDIIDESGKVIKEAIPNDLGQLRLMVSKLKAENEKLKAELEALKNKPVVEKVKEEVVDVPAPEKSTRGRKPKQVE